MGGDGCTATFSLAGHPLCARLRPKSRTGAHHAIAAVFRRVLPVPAEWYYYQNDTRVGPVESEHIQQLLSTGQLRANDLVWRNGMAGWSPILSVPELAPTVPLQRYGD